MKLREITALTSFPRSALVLLTTSLSGLDYPSVSARSCTRRLSNHSMSLLESAKKAAAFRAVDECVKVRKPTLQLKYSSFESHFILYNFKAILLFAGQGCCRCWQWFDSGLCSGKTWYALLLVITQCKPHLVDGGSDQILCLVWFQPKESRTKTCI